jgi:rfaE bifunctional protein nucleotidyltransferase chain/domain
VKRIGQLFGGRSSRAAGGTGKSTGGRTPAPAPLIQTLGVSNSLFADASNFDQRFVEDYGKIETTVNALRTLGFKIVLTSGSFDIIHEGHSMYLEAARQFGDFLIVGLDSDEKIRARKGDNRPVVPQMERLRMVTHQRGVGLVTLKQTSHPKWALIKAVRPDVLVATEETYTPAEIRELEAGYCGRVEVLDRMATVSTSARLRDVIQREMANPDSLVSTLRSEPGKPGSGKNGSGKSGSGRKRLAPAARTRG